MTVSLFTKSRYRTILIVIISVVIVAGTAAGTILLLKRYAPVKTTETASESTNDSTPSIKNAEALFAKGDYAGAKKQYTSILETYKTQNNETGIKDVELQLQIIDATANAPQPPQNTDRTRINAGSQSE